MKKTIAVLFTLALSALLSANTASKEIKLSAELIITEIETDVYLVTHSFPWPGNSLIVKTGDRDILWIDTPYTPDAAQNVLAWINQTFGSDASVTEINTGFHIDNLGGNEALLKKEISVYGSDLTCELLKKKSPSTMAKMVEWLKDEKMTKYRNVYASFKFYPPNRVFNINKEQKIKCGDEEAIVYYPGPTHTYDNLVVYLPERKILFGGCMIVAAESNKPGFVEDGNLSAWVVSMDKLSARFKDCRIIIPGHGKAGDGSLIKHTREVVSAALLNSKTSN
ncbi:MAG TPA: MBL fold metallo-hydrolase [Spirochaetota bacterium]|nr:MBL fold metallo-hydrolase [Spirochaetota bacterium]HOR44242.1 MBL fold metallo-hydrolase [Spirochaetota bacterium]HOU84674.1 MBL fold metallo-hydrolase [Spirochaetota bacterium]HPK55646.1 MBL fold metallo-hydrolase [Spirochaetota bacterium]HQE57740.1 MBL fold metallo-hydrolase [Spirochaetota bacterium]